MECNTHHDQTTGPKVAKPSPALVYPQKQLTLNRKIRI
ncbi:hypothetical protein AM1_0580 [Acaryochloris marina MBIC11017]|uniref:Uncharacterized protein n=1 Tax=Acaryochloris marina (strain MBIC 11017) TaxID=329726 RepID=B0CD39_ACAM1|nr:hypothetical protein AM1_0580 [Acaryochloris marina MBIC11017]